MQSATTTAPTSSKTQSTLNKHHAVIKLHYFNVRGTCQPLVNLLYFLDVPFQFIEESKTQQNVGDVGFNLGIPYIQDGDIKLHQTIAIMHYLCRKCQRNSLIGLTPRSTARIQQILMKYFAQRKKINAFILESICILPIRPQKQAFVDSFLKKLCAQCKFLDYCLKKLAKGSAFIVEEISIVDFFFYEICFYITGFFGNYIGNNLIYKFFKDFKARFESLPFFEKNRAQIEDVALFIAFGDEAVNTAIEETWNGGSYRLLLRS